MHYLCLCFFFHVGMTTAVIIVDLTMALQDGVRMNRPHLDTMTPTWNDALLLAEITMVMVAIHTEAEVREDLPLGICARNSDFFHL